MSAPDRGVIGWRERLKSFRIGPFGVCCEGAQSCNFHPALGCGHVSCDIIAGDHLHSLRSRGELALNNRFQILSLDGGGIRGVFTAAVLAALENDYHVRIADCYRSDSRYLDRRYYCIGVGPGVHAAGDGGILCRSRTGDLRQRGVVAVALLRATPVILPLRSGLRWPQEPELSRWVGSNRDQRQHAEKVELVRYPAGKAHAKLFRAGLSRQQWVATRLAAVKRR